MLAVRDAEDVTSKLVTLLHSTQRLFDERIRYFDKWNSSVNDQLESLRNKIEETKHLANGVNNIELKLNYYNTLKEK